MGTDGTLSPATVDVFLRAFNTVPGDRSGPTGRLTDAKNIVTRQYTPGNGMPQRIVVGQRNGFRSLTTSGHNSDTGATETVSWSNPELLSPLGSQLLSICNAVPRVYDGTDWTHYAYERVVSNVLTESVFHTSQRTIQAPDHAWKSGVTCSVWAEQLTPNDTTVTLYVGFRGDDGTWVRTPQVLYDPSANNDGVTCYARVIADTGANYFWVVFNRLITGTDSFQAILFDLNGQQIDSASIGKIWDKEPGYWDITQNAGGGCYFAQPLHTFASATDGVRFTVFTQSSGVISATTTDNASMHCRGPLAWATNDIVNSRYYLGTVGVGEGPGGKLWGYEISAPNATSFTNEYDYEVEIPGAVYPDTLIGFTVANADVSNPTLIPDLYLSFTVLSLPAQTAGAPNDPQLRYSQVYLCDFDDNSAFIRQNDYTCQVSRAFKHDGEYYSVNYYQSGSGRVFQGERIDVDYTAGDYMIGDTDQPLTVTPGDYTAGSPRDYTGVGFLLTGSQAAFSVLTGDTVEYVPAFVFPSGQVAPVLKWTLANLAVIPGSGRLTTAATTGVAGANGTWEIVYGPSVGPIYTLPVNTIGLTTLGGTFNTAGTAAIVQMSLCKINSLFQSYSQDTAEHFLIGSSIAMSGSATPANNGTKTIVRANTLPVNQSYGLSNGVAWVTNAGETGDSGMSATIHPALENDWRFAAEVFDDSYIGTELHVSGSEFTLPSGNFTSPPTTASNDNVYTVTDGNPTIDPHTLKTDGAAITAEIFAVPLPTAVVHLPADMIPFTFFLQDVTPDYTYIGATLSVQGDTVHDVNNGTYDIVGFDGPGHILYCKPNDGRTGQKNQQFVSDDQVITIFLNANVDPEYQPCWLMVPLTGTKPVVGRWEYGIAYADWRVEGVPLPFFPDTFPFSVSSPVRRTADLAFMLPYRAVSFTVGQTLVTVSGQIVNSATATNESTVGLKQFYLDDTTGNPTQTNDALTLPGPMCGEFTASGFHEQGVNFGFEAPFVVGQAVSSSGVALRKGGKYQYAVVAEVTDENGDRVFSVVSPPLNVELSGDNDALDIGGRLLQPLDTNGVAVPQHFGVTNWRLLSISVYRTSYQDDVPTTEHHKITLDLDVNGLAPVSDTNDSGFSFPDEFTWNYRDENLDAAIIGQEVLYVDKGYLPRFAAPAQRQGVLWKDREWLIGYDGAVWMSAEKKEGDATWFFLGWRFTQAIQDGPVALCPMDDYLLVFCANNAVWYIPAANFPDATGRAGALPAMLKTTFTNGGTGFAIPVQAGAAYSSTANGAWLVTRGQVNQWLSQPVQESLSSLPITGMAVDKSQRLAVSTDTGNLYVYDQVVQQWARWAVPVSTVAKLTTLDGNFAFQDGARVWLYTPNSYADDVNGSSTGIPIDITLSSLTFASVRAVKSLWEMQIIGAYKGPHRLNAVISYPDDDPANPTTFGPYTPDPSMPYLMAINPMVESASNYGLRIYTDFGTVLDPGDSCEIELVSCEVGTEGTMGLNGLLNSSRIEGR